MQYTDEIKKIYLTISIFSQFSGVSMKKIFIPFLILYTNNILPSTKSPQQNPQSSPQPQESIIHKELFTTPPPHKNWSLPNRSFPPAPPLPDRIGKPLATPERQSWRFQLITEDFPDSGYTGRYPASFSNQKSLFFLLQNLIAQDSVYPRIQISSVKLPYLQQLIIQVCMVKNVENGAIRYSQNCSSKFTVKYHKNRPDDYIPGNLSIFDIFSEPESARTDHFNNETSANISLILAKNPNILESEFIAQILNVYQSGTFIKES